mmetsp:Transcript_5419/g.8018  ORF Transcript_5419/g.8018 Transcript_5419/m.8018 type:complete len:494 (+) Transcript_5419:108-1589(+)
MLVDNITSVVNGGINITNETFNMTIEEEEEDIWPAYLTWIQKFFASMSILCSYVICREIISDLRNKSNVRSNCASPRVRNQTGSSLQSSIGCTLLNLSIADMIFSFAVFLGEWPAPKDTRFIHHASGNEAFCTFQGWLRAVGYLASPMFSVALNTFSLLLVRYRWRDQQLRKTEYKVRIGIWLYCLAWSIVPIPLHAYNSDWDVCWVVPAPLDCIDDCTRGLGAMYLERYFTFIHIWVCLVSSIVLMAILVHTVKSIEDKVSKYNHNSKSKVAASRSGMGIMKGETTVPFSSHQQKGDQEKALPIETNQHEHDNDNDSDNSNESIASRNVEKNNSDISSNHDKAFNTQDGEMNTENDPEKGNEGYHANTRKSFRSGVTRKLSSLSITIGLSKNRKAQAVARQCTLYTLAFLSTHLLDVIASIICKVNPGEFYRDLDIVAYMVFQPALGTINFLVFSRNRYTMATPEGRFLRGIFCCGVAKKTAAPGVIDKALP